MNQNHPIRSVDDLIAMIETGTPPKYLFFWGHTPLKNGATNQSCFSQWFESPFEINGERFQTAEHFMMVEKARLFADEEAAQNILASSTPNHAKALGRTVKNFDNDTWNLNRFDIVVKGNIAKFRQNPELAQFLSNSGDRVLVEASPPDRIWGIGMSKTDPLIEQPKSWKGLNLLGFALMAVRDHLK